MQFLGPQQKSCSKSAVGSYDHITASSAENFLWNNLSRAFLACIVSKTIEAFGVIEENQNIFKFKLEVALWKYGKKNQIKDIFFPICADCYYGEK